MVHAIRGLQRHELTCWRSLPAGAAAEIGLLKKEPKAEHSCSTLVVVFPPSRSFRLSTGTWLEQGLCVPMMGSDCSPPIQPSEKASRTSHCILRRLLAEKPIS